MYTIKEAAARTGVPIALLRAWERRYRVVEPVRTSGGYRVYDEPALDRLRTMRRLVDDGWSPSLAAAAILRGEAGPAPAGAEAAVTGDAAETGAQGPLVDDFVGAAIAIDPAAVEGALDAMFAAGTFEHVADGILVPALEGLGDAWATGRLGIAGEHAASHAVLRRLAAAFQAAGRAGQPEGSILVGLPPGSRHELAALAFSVAARRAGLPITYLGPDLPAADWVTTSERLRAAGAVIGAPTRADVRAAVEVARAIRSADPTIVVAFGGRFAADAAGSLNEAGPTIVLPNGLVAAVEALRDALPRSASAPSAR